ncbi:MAG: hypothetical protein LBI54_10495 [Lachnospiraceae bacterium]|jgi:hypothetical protein|nr:hypothetical protein [Lachnospiraceae bacterium]
MATDTFYKRIVLSNEAAEILADGFDKPRKPYRKSMSEIMEDYKRGEDLLKRMSASEK